MPFPGIGSTLKKWANGSERKDKMANLRMPNVNEVRLVGRLTHDPELRATADGSALCTFGLAVSRKYKNKAGEQREETVFIKVTTWRKTAKYCGESLKKGHPVFLDGKLTTSEWTDKATGNHRTAIEVEAVRVQGLAWPDDEAPQQKPPPAPTHAKTRHRATTCRSEWTGAYTKRA